MFHLFNVHMVVLLDCDFQIDIKSVMFIYIMDD